MAKITNTILAKKIADRIKEILTITELSIDGLSKLSNIGKTYLNTFLKRTIPITVESVEKICNGMSISLRAFFDFNNPLSPDLKSRRLVKEFYDTHFKVNPEYFVIAPDPKIIRLYPKDDKDRLKYIVRETNYFYSGRLTNEMVEDFKNEYGVEFESGRLSQMLKSHLDILDKVPSVKLNKDGTPSKKQVFKYVKKKK